MPGCTELRTEPASGSCSSLGPCTVMSLPGPCPSHPLPGLGCVTHPGWPQCCSRPALIKPEGNFCPVRSPST